MREKPLSGEVSARCHDFRVLYNPSLMLAWITESSVPLAQAVLSISRRLLCSFRWESPDLTHPKARSKGRQASQACPVWTGEILTLAWGKIKFQLLRRGFITWSRRLIPCGKTMEQNTHRTLMQRVFFFFLSRCQRQNPWLYLALET